MGLRKKLQQRLIRKCAVTDTPWTTSMSSHNPTSSSTTPTNPNDGTTTTNPTIAPFSPNQQTASTKTGPGSRSSILVYQKSPLLVATPPQVTRALAYSHPFILPLNHIAGLLSWTTGDPWSSFLLLATFWFGVLYGDAVVRWAGPVVVVAALILGMYSRSTLWNSGEGKGKGRVRGEAEQRKSLDEILETLQTFTGRCDVLLDPFLRLTEFLSTQSSATSATTRPALTSLFLRILALTPFWILLTLPPLYIITTKRVLLVIGTVGLSWHSRPARVTRTLLWRSRTIRNALSVITGLTFTGPLPTTPTAPALTTKTKDLKPQGPTQANAKPGVRFAFTLYENQRRWLGLGWTASLLSYERQAWTDEHLTSTPDISAFELPDTESETTKWRWVPSTEWRVEGATKDGKDERSAKRIGGGGGGDDVGWVYYDNKWRDGRRVDGWDRYTRRRKWVRDAELVEVSAEGEEVEGVVTASGSGVGSGVGSEGDEGSVSSTTAKRKGWFGNGNTTPKKVVAGRAKVKKDRSDAGSGKAGSVESVRSRDDSGDDVHTPTRYREFQWDRSIGEGVMEGLS
ncbi:hypothetical protein LTR10_005858 [Elasticomyces elasticus]|nr:hypothetical protein LTR10_005858 [Elasticomyces elasticus]KAK4965063.1 hypothetical protein LTR42_012482 [Elasticomyces elasticus]